MCFQNLHVVSMSVLLRAERTQYFKLANLVYQLSSEASSYCESVSAQFVDLYKYRLVYMQQNLWKTASKAYVLKL